MTIRPAWLWVLTALACATGASAQVDLARLDHGVSGPRTQVLVLGTTHLAQAPKGFKAASLQPLLQRLAAFKPDIIAIEAISGEDCGQMKQYPSLFHPEDIAPYCIDTVAAQEATGLDRPSAAAVAHRLLAQWPARPTPAQRRHLAAVFLANEATASALVQWLQLPPAERHAGDGMDAALVAEMNRRMESNNESFQIAARLAANLGLQRVFPVDDHRGDNLDLPAGQVQAFGAALSGAWDKAAATAAPGRKLEQNLLASGRMLELYRHLNRPTSQQAAVEADMGAALGDGTPPYYGHMYVTGWEARNLYIAANILQTCREHPGARVLVIIGATHKPWLDHILGAMPGIAVVDAEQVLGDSR